MKRRYDLYLQDILDAIDRVQGYVSVMSLPALKKDIKTVEAATRALEIMGEAVSQLDENVKKRYPEVSWQRIKDFRNVIVHQYWQVDVEILWTIVKEKLPPLREQIQQVLKEEKRK